MEQIVAFGPLLMPKWAALLTLAGAFPAWLLAMSLLANLSRSSRKPPISR